jgi:nucleoid-associated protein YgaU
MDRIKLAGIFILTSAVALSGCVARTYELTRDRVDQDLSSSTAAGGGNRGYIMGQPPAEPKDRKTTRTTRVFEVELGLANKSSAKCPSTTPLAANNNTEETTMAQETPMAQETMNEGAFEKYTVRKNDTLQKISQKFYGTTKRWMKIYEANKDVLRGPDKLYPGQTLNIPVSSQSKMAEPKENLK